MDAFRKQIDAIIQNRYSKIALAYLFGSRVDGNVGPQSDYDFAVLLDRDAEKATVRSNLSSDLAKLLQSQRMDIVFLGDAPIELSFAVISQGQILYERDVQTRVDFEARIMGLYFDYLPFLRKSRDDILKEDPYAARVLRYRKALGRTQRTLDQIGAAQREESSGF